MDHRLAIVTGAAKGIGEASARRFRREGHLVIGIATSPVPASLADDGDVHWVQGDVSDTATWIAVRDRYQALGTPPATLVLNAARAMIGTVTSLELEQWHRLFDGNFFGAVLG
ncbi:MAG: SDR family oxidoreductase, partial [Chloroflexi bacterium]|nr:SDR family oxidoreductase [Chloroflexota bacterium]